MSEQGGCPCVLVVLHLYNTLYIPQAKVNLFSLLKMRKAHYQAVQMKRIRIESIENESGQYVGSTEEDEEGRAVVKCRTLLPPPSLLPSELLLVEVVAKEALAALVDIELLHRRLGHMGMTTMTRLGKEELVRGVAGGLKVCHGCELGKALASHTRQMM